MAFITSNPRIDLVSEQENVVYIDDGTAIFKCLSDPEGLIAANAGSFAIDNAGNWYRKTTNAVATGWTSATSGGGGTPGGIGGSVQYNDGAGSFAGDDAFLWDNAGFILTLGEAGVSAGKLAFGNSSNANLITLQAGASGSNFTLTLPIDDGSSGQFLQTNGSGVLSWAASYTPGGIANSVQYNNGGGLIDGDVGLLFDAASNTLDIGTASLLDGKLRFKNSANGNIVTIQPGASGSNFTLTLPIDDGSSGNFLQTNGSGVLSWQSGAVVWNNISNPTGNLSLAMGSSLSLFTWAGNFGSGDAFELVATDTTATGNLLRITTGVSSLIQPFLVEARSGQSIKADHLRNVIIGQDDIAAAATDGFAYIGFIAAQAEPSGTPTAYSGYAPIVLENDLVNGQFRLWSYLSGAWRNLSSGSPAGSNKQIQFNNSGSFGGAAGFEYQSGASPNVLITAQNAAHVALRVKGAASQSANLFDLIDSSSTVLTSFTATGLLQLPGSAGTVPSVRIGTENTGPRTFGSPASLAILVNGSIRGAFRRNENGFAFDPGGFFGWTTTAGDPSTTLQAALTSPGSGIVRVSNASTGSGLLIIGNSTDVIAGSFSVIRETSATNAVVTNSKFTQNSSGTPANGLGVGLNFNVETSTTPDTSAGELNCFWNDITHASRSAITAIRTVTNAGSMADGLRIQNGGARVPAGLSASTYALIGGTLSVNTTQVGNVGTGEDDLMTYSLPANSLATNGESVEIEAFGTFASNVNNKEVKLYFGATVIFATGALAFNGDDWRINASVIRTGATAQITTALFASNGALLAVSTISATPAETLSGAVTIKCTGEGTANDDIAQFGMIIKWQPAGN